jgi:hypothetical protein
MSLGKGMFVKDKRFETVFRFVDHYRETDIEDGSRYTVVVLETEEGGSFAIADNIFKANYTILEDTKELKIKSLLIDYKNYRNKYDSMEKAALKQLKETGEHHYHDSFDSMENWEEELFERAEYLGVNLLAV